MFLQWNAERLNISLQESQQRYFASWSAIRGGHAGSDYRSFNGLSYDLFQVFVSDTQKEVPEAYDLHSYMHFLRMLSYPEPNWKANDAIVAHLDSHSEVAIIDYGCGLAQRSKALGKCLSEKGVTVELILVDIPTLRREFLLWCGKQTSIQTTFLACTPTRPMPDLPSCDICFATEFFEHVYEPVRYFEHIHHALKPQGVLVTNTSDHDREFMHVSPDLHALRERIHQLAYREWQTNRIFSKP